MLECLTPRGYEVRSLYSPQLTPRHHTHNTHPVRVSGIDPVHLLTPPDITLLHSVARSISHFQTQIRLEKASGRPVYGTQIGRQKSLSEKSYHRSLLKTVASDSLCCAHSFAHEIIARNCENLNCQTNGEISLGSLRFKTRYVSDFDEDQNTIKVIVISIRSH